MEEFLERNGGLLEEFLEELYRTYHQAKEQTNGVNYGLNQFIWQKSNCFFSVFYIFFALFTFFAIKDITGLQMSSLQNQELLFKWLSIDILIISVIIPEVRK